jgi:hypothetical protein
LLGIYSISLLIQALLFLNWDVASLLHATRQLLAGGNYVKDIFTPNLPMILYLYTPPVMISKLLNLDIITVFRVYVYLLSSASLVMCYQLIKNYFRNHEHDLTNLFMVTLACAYLVLPTYEFGNRDHLLLMLTMPYVLAVVSRLRGDKLYSSFAILIGLSAGIGFAMKPQFLVTFALIELYCMYFQKNLLAGLRVETLVITAVLMTYAVSMFLFQPDYIFIIVPFLMRNYYPAIGMPLKVLTRYPLTVFCFMTIFLYLFSRPYKNQQILFTVLLVALAGSILSIYLQHTLFYYHFLPALSIASLLSVMMLYLLGREMNVANTFKLALLAAAYITVDICLYNYTWSNIVYYPRYFYGFFAAAFAFLFYISQRKIGLLSVCARVFLIVAIGALCSALLIATEYYMHRFLFTLLLMSTLYLLLINQLTRNFIQAAVLAALVMSMFYVPAMQEYYLYLGPRQYKDGALNKLTKFIDSRGRHQSIYVFSAAIYYTFPLVFYANANPAQRFDQLWPILGLLDKKKLSLQSNQDKKFFIDMVADDLQRNKPDLIFIDNDHILAKGFDYVSFFSENPNFLREWKSYRYLTTLPLGVMNNVDTRMPVYERINN